MTSTTLNLDPLKTQILEAFTAALAQLDSDLPDELRQEINQVGEALANNQTESVAKLLEIAHKHNRLCELYEAADISIDEKFNGKQHNRHEPPPDMPLSESPYRSNISAPIDKVLQILSAKIPEAEARKIAAKEKFQTPDDEQGQDIFWYPGLM